MDQHNHLDEALVFNAKCIISLLHVGESHRISELSSWNPFATNLALTFSSALIYFSEKTHLKSINFQLHLVIDCIINFMHFPFIKFI